MHLLGLLGEPDGVHEDEFAGTVIALDATDVVLIRLEASGLTTELPLPSAVAIDLVLRGVGGLRPSGEAPPQWVSPDL